WTVSDPARVTVDAFHKAVLSESAADLEVHLYQDFVIPAGSKVLAFTLSGLTTDEQLLSGEAPDAFGVALLHPLTLAPLTATVDAATDAYYIRDLAPGVSQGEAAAGVTVLAGAQPGSLRIVLNVEALGGQAARLVIRLLGGSNGSRLDGRVAISDVVVTNV